MLSVENPVGPPIPEFDQATEERPKVPAGMTGQKSRNVLEEDDGRSVNIDKVEEGVGEAAAGLISVCPVSTIAPRLDPPSPALSAGDTSVGSISA